jgi:phosphate-selective porin OprO/OprP
MLTGEENSFFGIKPTHNFDPEHGHWGAWQLAARYSELSIDKSTFSNGFASAKNSVRDAQSWAVGINWYLNENVKIMADYEQTFFVGGAGLFNRPIEKVLFSRVQVAF